jgi:hypothetical protein
MEGLHNTTHFSAGHKIVAATDVDGVAFYWRPRYEQPIFGGQNYPKNKNNTNRVDEAAVPCQLTRIGENLATPVYGAHKIAFRSPVAHSNVTFGGVKTT